MRKLCAFALPFGAAVFLAVYLVPETLWLAGGLLCVLAGAAALLLLRRKLPEKWQRRPGKLPKWI